MRGLGLDAKLRVCPGCADVIDRNGLREKNPLLAVAAIVKLGRSERPPVHAYFQHPEWRKVWMHTLENLQVEARDEFEALAKAKAVEDRLFDQVMDQSKSAESPPRPETSEAQHVQTRSEKIGSFLQFHITVVLEGDPTVVSIKNEFAGTHVDVEIECIILLIALAQVVAHEKYGSQAAEHVFAGLLPLDEQTDPARLFAVRQRLRSYVDAYRSGQTESDRTRNLAAAVLATLDPEREYPKVEEAIGHLIREQHNHLQTTLDFYQWM